MSASLNDIFGPLLTAMLKSPPFDILKTLNPIIKLVVKYGILLNAPPFPLITKDSP